MGEGLEELYLGMLDLRNKFNEKIAYDNQAYKLDEELVAIEQELDRCLTALYKKEIQIFESLLHNEDEEFQAITLP